MTPTKTMILVTALAGLTGLTATRPDNASPADDKREILDHIHSIFRAYMEADEATIEATHSKDWTGFNGQSRSIVRGIDGYMANARRALAGARIVRYELEETEIQIHGDIGIAYYVANWSIRAKGLEQLVRIHARSVDIYEKRSGKWIQIGSNLNTLPRPGATAKPECQACFDVELEG